MGLARSTRTAAALQPLPAGARQLRLGTLLMLPWTQTKVPPRCQHLLLLLLRPPSTLRHGTCRLTIFQCQFSRTCVQAHVRRCFKMQAGYVR